MEYLDVASARQRPGLRLALTAGGPGPWSEAAKYVFAVKKIPFTPVRQASAEPNEELFAWSGHRNAPIAIFDEERPRASWSEILLLAERLSPQPPLLPEDAADHALALGLAHELCGEEGLGWARRLTMTHALLSRCAREGKPGGRMAYIGSLYGYTPENGERAVDRVVAVLEMLAARLRAQRAAGQSHLVGSALSAPDLYWAAFAAMFSPLPAELCRCPNPCARPTPASIQP